MTDPGILSVPRPKNTIVDDNGGNGVYRYAVRVRAPRKGKNPANGKTIGHIIDGKFVPKGNKTKTGSAGPEFCSYGASAFVWSAAQDIKALLLDIFPANDALRILAIACVYAICPHVANNRIGSEYKRSFLSVYMPGLKLTKNTVGSLIEAVGIDGAKRREFVRRRIDAVCGRDHIAIDGTLKQNTSTVNSFSAFSYKGRVKGVQDISILYAYDLERKEPLCAQVFPGNCIDAVSYDIFIRTNGITKGIIIADKGFPVSAIRKTLEENPELHYLSPLKRNDKRIEQYNMLDFEVPLKRQGSGTMCKKTKMEDGNFLYSYKDIKRSCAEHLSFIELSQRKDDWDKSKYDKKKEGFGIIVFVSDQDLDLETVYQSYEERWELETLFDMYKHDLDLTTTRVQNEYSIIGQEFVNLIATTITARCVRKADETGILRTCTYKDLLTDLDRVLRKTDAPKEPDVDDDGWLIHFSSTFNKMVLLGLCTEAEKAAEFEQVYELSTPKGPGRPKKEPKEAEAANKPMRGRGRPKSKPEFVGPKRPRGRPRKAKQESSQS